MKKFTNFVKLFCVLALCFGAKSMQGQCSISFAYTVNANGNVTFSATPTASFNQLYWTFGNGQTYSTVQPTLSLTASTNYTANGNYVVNLSAVGPCSVTSSQTINVTISSGTVCNLSAGYNANLGNNGVVNFISTSTGTVLGMTTYSMNYGDGTSASGMTPGSGLGSHTYTANGVYTATLTANVSMTPACTSTYVSTFTVSSVCTPTMGANYTYTLGANGTATFASTSTGTTGSTTYNWNFSGPASSTVITGTSPLVTNTYSLNGSYGVYLNIYNAAPSCTATSAHTVAITTTATACNLVANFTANQSAGGVANMHSTSTGTAAGTTFSWNYGDGNTGTGYSVSHTYTANGSYTLTLTANNNTTPTCVSTKTLVINITTLCNLNAAFNYSLGANGSVSFANTSTGTNSTTTSSWTFGNGGTSTVTSPSATYYNGTYTVTLLTTNFGYTPACASTATQVITVTSNTCVANSTFSLMPSGTPQYWYAVISSTTGVTSAVWSWGDGSSSSSLLASHTYSAAGNYSICLTVTVSCGATSTSCYTYYISKGTDQSVVYVQTISQEEAMATGINTSSANNINYSVFPNPNNGSFKLNVSGLGASKAKINVYTLVGALVYSAESDTTNGSLVKDLNLDAVSGGVYFIKITADNKEYTKKLIINK